VADQTETRAALKTPPKAIDKTQELQHPVVKEAEEDEDVGEGNPDPFKPPRRAALGGHLEAASVLA